MDRHLRDLEQFRDGRISRREFHRRAAWIAGGVAVAEFFESVAPPAALATSSIMLDPTQDPLTQGYQTEGAEPYIFGARLTIMDTSSVDRRLFFTNAPEIAAGDVSVDF